MHRRWSATCAAQQTAAVRILLSPDSRRSVAARACARGEELFRFTGSVQRTPGMYSLMVGREMHMVAPPEVPEPAWIFMEHSFSPSVALHHVSVSSTAATLAATAAVDLQPDDLVSFDYCLHEWLMSEPFRDAESGRLVDGFANLTEEEQDLALPRAQPHIRLLHAQYLFGQSSRC